MVHTNSVNNNAFIHAARAKVELRHNAALAGEDGGVLNSWYSTSKTVIQEMYVRKS